MVWRRLALTIKLFNLFSRDSSAACDQPGNLTVSLLLILVSEPHFLIKVKFELRFLAENEDTAGSRNGIRNCPQNTRNTQKGRETESRKWKAESRPDKTKRGHCGVYSILFVTARGNWSNNPLTTAPSKLNTGE